MKYKIRLFFSFFKPSNLKRQIEALGGSISKRDVVLLVFALVVANFIVGYLFGLKPGYTMGVLMCLAFFMPYIVVLKFKGDYEQIRFNDATEYMEQMLNSFHKSGKIHSALQDVYLIASSTMKEVIKQMILCLEEDAKEVHLFEKCFSIMESSYDCTRMRTLHKYLIECEYTGGDSAEGLSMLLDDVRGWSERTIDYIRNRKKVRKYVSVSIFLAMLSCGMITRLMPADYSVGVIAQPLYQIGTSAALVACIIIYLVVLQRTSLSYLDLEMSKSTDAYIQSRMDYLSNYSRKNQIKIMFVKALMFVPVIGGLYYIKLRWAILPTLGVLMFVILQNWLTKVAAVKAVQNELNKTFPNWIRILVLYLQSDNVHVAISKSIDSCPALLKREVSLFAQDLANNPTSMMPYKRFLASFKVPTLRLSINYLYSLAQFGTDDMISQLDYLVKLNMRLTVNEEKIRNQDALAGINLFVFAPMLVAVFKMVLDMSLFMSSFMNVMSNYV